MKKFFIERMRKLASWDYAHRGLHDIAAAMPENSIAAFKAALDNGYGAELDIHLLKDGNLAVIHDSSLLRTAGADVIAEDLTVEDIENYRLLGSDEKIPSLQNVLALFEGRAPLVIELKAYKNNAAALCEAACKVLDNYKGDYCIESFDPRCLRWFKKNRPHVLRGQLSQNFLKSPSGLGKIVDFFLTSLILNAVTRPHFIAYRFSDMGNFPYRAYTKLFKTQGAAWTINTEADYHDAKSKNLLVIFEGFKP